MNAYLCIELSYSKKTQKTRLCVVFVFFPKITDGIVENEELKTDQATGVVDIPEEWLEQHKVEYCLQSSENCIADGFARPSTSKKQSLEQLLCVYIVSEKALPPRRH
ncbi:hypothetical protein Y032_0007g3408 [Ancylostoma ceylanicum]|uniref:Uncharacterized protein n=1 Tax=Ancylostoma ceylanicum TaxID=53326 RepID=A0A016VNZ4_9BILA|nr:hypothetical protein Y032_0007g3408 [Ancylostoma ceylanicum]